MRGILTPSLTEKVSQQKYMKFSISTSGVLKAGELMKLLGLLY